MPFPGELFDELQPLVDPGDLLDELLNIGARWRHVILAECWRVVYLQAEYSDLRCRGRLGVRDEIVSGVARLSPLGRNRSGERGSQLLELLIRCPEDA